MRMRAWEAHLAVMRLLSKDSHLSTCVAAGSERHENRVAIKEAGHENRVVIKEAGEDVP